MMASFAKQASNLSALESKIDRLLKVPGPNEQSEDFLRSKDKERNAEVFFSSQRNRVDNIEKELLAATGSILPLYKESKTITELAELCRLCQNTTREKLEKLRLCLEDEGYAITQPSRAGNLDTKIIVSRPSPSLEREPNERGGTAAQATNNTFFASDSNRNYLSSNGSSSQTPLPRFANIGGPLESVLEADYETDGITTPGSCLDSPGLSSDYRGSPASMKFKLYDGYASMTPTLSARKKKLQNQRISSSLPRSSPSTPPTLDRLSISASTNDFLQNMSNDGEKFEGKSSPILLKEKGHEYFSINDMSFSNKTSKMLVEKGQNGSWQQEKQQQHLYEFRDEDDMITLDTQSTMTKSKNLYSPNVAGDVCNTETSLEERSQFIARMEGILERVEENIFEGSPSLRRYSGAVDLSRLSNEPHTASVLFSQGKGNDQTIVQSFTPKSSCEKAVKRSYRYSGESLEEKNSFSSSMDEYSSLDLSRDSTNLVATQIAGTGSSKNGTSPNVSNESKNNKKQESLNTFHHCPTQIYVDTEIMSPAHTNITMDATFMNEANESSFVRGKEIDEDKTKQQTRRNTDDDAEEDIDNVSTITPILDRYRLDASDENSVGVKVVPNKRNAHRSIQKQTTPRQGRLPTIAQLSPTLGYFLQAKTPEKEFNHSMLTSPAMMTSDRMATTKTPLSQIKKVYRKTPFPKKKPGNGGMNDAIGNAVDENDNPNTVTKSLALISSEVAKYDEGSFSISIPPLRPNSFEPKRANESMLGSGVKRTLSLPEEDQSSTTYEFALSSSVTGASRHPYLQEETYTIQKIDKTIERIDLELASPTSMGGTRRMGPVT